MRKVDENIPKVLGRIDEKPGANETWQRSALREDRSSKNGRGTSVKRQWKIPWGFSVNELCSTMWGRVGSSDLQKLSIRSGTIKHAMLLELGGENSWNCPSSERYWSMDKWGGKVYWGWAASIRKDQVEIRQITKVKSLQQTPIFRTMICLYQVRCKYLLLGSQFRLYCIANVIR